MKGTICMGHDSSHTNNYVNFGPFLALWAEGPMGCGITFLSVVCHAPFAPISQKPMRIYFYNLATMHTKLYLTGLF